MTTPFGARRTLDVQNQEPGAVHVPDFLANGTADAYPVIFTALAETDGGGFLASFPDLPGCYSHGMTRAEALERSHEAVNLWIKAAEERGLQVPLPNSAAGVSGNITVRAPRAIHKRAHALARIYNVTFNAMVATLVADAILALYGVDAITHNVLGTRSAGDAINLEENLSSMGWNGQADYILFSGTWSQRFEPAVHHELRFRANEQGCSLNSLVVNMLTFGVCRREEELRRDMEQSKVAA